VSELKIEVTHRCELRCLHCSSVDDQPVPDMALDDFRAIVDWAHDYGVGKLTISGGEPLLWPSLLRAVEDAKRPSYRRCAPTEEHGSVLDVTLYTSGYPRITDATAKNLQLVGVDRVIFGVHGVTARTYDGITGVAGSCDIATESLGAIQRQGIPCEVHVVPVKPNVREMDGVARVYGAFGVEQVSYLRFVLHGRGQTNRAALELTQDETRVLATHILRTKTRFEQIGYGATKIRVGVPFNILCLDKQAAFNCSAGLYRATIGPDLRVYPCDGFKHITPEMIGVEGPHPSLRDHDLSWCLDQSEYFKRARQLARENYGASCRSCGNQYACQGGCVAQKILAGLQATDPDPGCLAEKT
jgi:radical SAM protein with 4Fe4S-binding SPASM domain